MESECADALALSARAIQASVRIVPKTPFGRMCRISPNHSHSNPIRLICIESANHLGEKNAARTGALKNRFGHHADEQMPVFAKRARQIEMKARGVLIQRC